jgi:two-component system chemotaxis response regulator CheY
MKILIVDDALFMRAMLRKALEPLGYEINEAENGREAVEQCRLWKPDLITLDIVMPEMDGLQALAAIRKEMPATRVVMVTAVDQREPMREAMNLGISDFIVKPFDENRVVSAIDRALARAG